MNSGPLVIYNLKPSRSSHITLSGLEKEKNYSPTLQHSDNISGKQGYMRSKRGKSILMSSLFVHNHYSQRSSCLKLFNGNTHFGASNVYLDPVHFEGRPILFQLWLVLQNLLKHDKSADSACVKRALEAGSVMNKRNS